MPLERVGLKAVIDGMGQFTSAAGTIDKTYGRLGEASERTAGRMSKLGGIITTAIGFGVGQIGVKALGAFTGGLKDMILGAAPLADQYEAFGKLTESYGFNAEEMMKKMDAAAKGTVADSELMASANKALVGAGADLGKEFGEKLPALLEIARASAKATGEDVNFLFDSLVLGIKRGSPMIIDNTGLQLKLGEAQEKYAAALGITVEQMSAEQKQIALLNATTEAGADLVERMGSATLTTAEKMAKIRAQTKNLKEAIGLALLPILSKVLDLLIPIAEWLGDVLPRAVERVMGVFTRFGSVLGTLGQYFSVIREDGDVLNDFLSNLPRPIRGVVLAFGKLTAIFRTLGQYFSIVREDGDFLNDFLTHLPEPIRGVVLAFGKLTAKLGRATEHFARVRMVLWDVFNAFRFLSPGDFPWEDIFPPWLAKRAYEFSSVFEQVVKDIRGFFDILLGFAMRGIGLTGGIWATVFPEWLPGTITSIGDSLREMWATAKDVFAVFQSLAPGDFPWEDIFPPWLAKRAYEFSSVFEGVVKAVRKGMARIAEVDPYGGLGVALLTAVSPALGLSVAAIIGSGALEELQAWWDENHATLLKTATDVWEEIKKQYGFGDTDVLAELQGKLLPVETWWAEHHGRLGSVVTTTWDETIIPTFERANLKITEFMEGMRLEFPSLERAILVSGTVIATAVLFKILGPIGLVFAAVQIGRKAWEENWGGIRDKVTEVTASMSIDIEGLKAKGLELWEDFGGNLIKLRDDAVAKLGEVWESTFGGMLEAWNLFWDGFSPSIEVMQDFFNWWVSEELLPKLDKLSMELSNTWTEHLVPAIKDIIKQIDEFFERHPEFKEFLRTAIGLVGTLAGTTALLVLKSSLTLVTDAIHAMTLALQIANPLIDTMTIAVDLAIRAVEGLFSAVSSMWSLVQRAWNWINEHTFNIKVTWPSLPEYLRWFLPGSPPPALVGFRAINQELSRTADLFARLGTGMMAPSMTAMMTPALAAGSHITNVYQGWQPTINANYSTVQSPTSIRTDLEAFAIMLRLG